MLPIRTIHTCNDAGAGSCASVSARGSAADRAAPGMVSACVAPNVLPVAPRKEVLGRRSQGRTYNSKEL
jgi:hypothetical protein